jgi:hypothetical protein
MDAMRRKPRTVDRLQKSTGFASDTTRRIVKEQWRKGNCHICGWEKVSGNQQAQAIYRWGAGENVPRPPTDKAEMRRKNREYARTAQLKKAIENPQSLDVEAKHLARIAEELARPAFRDPLVAALFGEYRRAA